MRPPKKKKNSIKKVQKPNDATISRKRHLFFLTILQQEYKLIQEMKDTIFISHAINKVLMHKSTLSLNVFIFSIDKVYMHSFENDH